MKVGEMKNGGTIHRAASLTDLRREGHSRSSGSPTSRSDKSARLSETARTLRRHQPSQADRFARLRYAPGRPR